MYEKFHENDVTTDVLWDLNEEVLNDILKLNALEKIKYEKAKKNALKTKN